ncbi:MAG: thymidine kinase [Gemmatimonadota bacterium]|jgi:thymidine kinase
MGRQNGWIEVITGVMFSGKSEELIRRVRRALLARREVKVFKSFLDDRYTGVLAVHSHDGRTLEATPVSGSRELQDLVGPKTQVVAVDEVQFLDAGIVTVSNSLASAGIRVILAGTDMDFRGRPFGPMPALMAVAEKVDKLHAICVQCGEPATRNQRLVDGEPAPEEGPTIQVGGLEHYEARCRRCHQLPTVGRDQTRLSMDPGDTGR